MNAQHALGSVWTQNKGTPRVFSFKGKGLFISRALFYGKKLRMHTKIHL